MSRTPWLGRSTGKHAAPGRGRAKAAARSEQAPERNARADGAAPRAEEAPADPAAGTTAAPGWAGPTARLPQSQQQPQPDEQREADDRRDQVPPWERQEDPDDDAPPWALAGGGGMLGAPTLEDVTPDAAAPLGSPVTDAARAASAAPSALLPTHVPPGSEPVITIDALGRKCPIPIIMLAEQIRDVPVGAVIAVLADDPAAYSDIPAWCGLKSHDCVFRAGHATGWSFGIRRRY